MPTTIEEYRYEAEVKRMAAQDATLGNMRNRAVWLLSMASVLVTVSVAVGRIVTDSTKGNPIPGWAAQSLVGIVASITVIVILLLIPWGFAPTPRGEYFGAGVDISVNVKAAIAAMGKEVKKNQKVIAWISRGLMACSALLGAEMAILLWVALQ